MAKAANSPPPSPAPAAPDWLGGGQKGEGWEALKDRDPAEVAAERDEAMLAQYEIAKLVHECLAQGRGPELMEYLRERLIMVPATRLHGALGADMLEIPITPEQWLWIRTGMNMVFHFFEAEIVKAEQGPPRVAAGEGG